MGQPQLKRTKPLTGKFFGRGNPYRRDKLKIEPSNLEGWTMYSVRSTLYAIDEAA